MEANEPEKAPFQEATAPIYDQYIKDGAGMVSPDIYQRVEDVLASMK